MHNHLKGSSTHSGLLLHSSQQQYVYKTSCLLQSYTLIWDGLWRTVNTIDGIYRHCRKFNFLWKCMHSVHCSIVSHSVGVYAVNECRGIWESYSPLPSTTYMHLNECNSLLHPFCAAVNNYRRCQALVNLVLIFIFPTTYFKSQFPWQIWRYHFPVLFSHFSRWLLSFIQPLDRFSHTYISGTRNCKFHLLAPVGLLCHREDRWCFYCCHSLEFCQGKATSMSTIGSIGALVGKVSEGMLWISTPSNCYTHTPSMASNIQCKGSWPYIFPQTWYKRGCD